jgi:ribosome-associated protein YbcJ (S4-like RNA binding protein)
METFDLEFKSRVKPHKLLRKRDLFLTKREAKDLVIFGMVSVNGITETRPRAKVRLGDVVEIEGQKIILE